MSVVFSVVAQWRHRVLLKFSPGYRQIRERLKEISEPTR